jgi:hypothetical protein
MREAIWLALGVMLGWFAGVFMSAYATVASERRKRIAEQSKVREASLADELVRIEVARPVNRGNAN